MTLPKVHSTSSAALVAHHIKPWGQASGGTGRSTGVTGRVTLTRKRRATWFLALMACLLPLAARAQIGSDRYSAIVIDAASGRVLSSMNPDEPRYPASLTKMMTLFMLFEALRDRRASLDDAVPVSVHAASMVPSKLGLVPGTHLTVEQAVLGLVTKSANDAAAALAEYLGGGDEDRFAQMMTLRARALGMSHTQFRNASGLPDYNQVTTARDMAVLARHIIQDFPTEYRYFSTPSFVFHGHVIYNHDRMLQTYPGADGLKTGWIEASGHNLVTSAVHSDVRLIGVVLGAASNAERDVDMRTQLDDGFDEMKVPSLHMPALVATAQAATMPRQMMAAPPSVAPPSAPARPPMRLADVRIAAAPGRPTAAAWTMQVGAYATPEAARQAALAARREGGQVRIEQAYINRHPVWRAQVTGLREPDALNGCALQSRRRAPCAVLPPDQVASSR